MKNTVKFLLVSIAVSCTCAAGQAQLFKRLGDAAKNAAERAATRKVEQKTEQAVDKAVDKATDAALDGLEQKRQQKEAELIDALNLVDSLAQAAEAGDAKSTATTAASPKKLPNRPADLGSAYFPEKEGLTQIYSLSNDKGKVQSQTKQTIVKSSGSGANRSIDYSSEMLDAKGNSHDPAQIVDLHIDIVNGVLTLDMKSLLSGMKGMEDLGGMSVEGSPTFIPSNIQAGDELDDAEVSVKIGFMKMTVLFTDGKCEASESITTPAGTFKCVKITQSAAVKAMGISTKMTMISWYAKGVGLVRQETADNKGKLQSVQELISVSN